MAAKKNTKKSVNVSAQQRDQLIDVLTTLDNRVRRQNSLKYVFVRGIVYGLGTVIGASLLVALFGGIIANVINELAGEPVIIDTLQR